MQTPPNHTVVIGVLTRYDAAADGVGGEIEIEVSVNVSPDPASDFIRPESGKPLRAFYNQPAPAPAKLPIGRRVRVDLTFLGGPFGSRCVVQKLRAE